MKFEVDQSGRIEETNRDTIIAVANKEIQVSMRIPRVLKRRLELIFKRQGRPKLFAVRVFAISVYLLIKKSKINPQVLIFDIEYPGYEKIISEIVNKNFRKDIYISFAKIGKKSPAHIKAYYTYKKKLKEDYVVNFDELEPLATKK